MFSCIRYRRQLSAYLDGELSARKRKSVEIHVAQCTACNRILTEMHNLAPILLSLEISEPPSDLASRIITAAHSHQLRDKNRLGVVHAWRILTFQFAWQFKMAVAAALIFGAAMGGFLGWDMGRQKNTIMANTVKTSVNVRDGKSGALDTFGGMQGGSIEAVTLALFNI